MAKTYAQLTIGLDSFGSWLDRTNQLSDDLTNYVMTVGPVSQPNSTNGAWVSGNGAIQGIFSANTVAVPTALRGGTVSTPANLNITSNAVFTGARAIFEDTTPIFANSDVTIHNDTKVFNVVMSEFNFTTSNTTIKSSNLHITNTQALVENANVVFAPSANLIFQKDLNVNVTSADNWSNTITLSLSGDVAGAIDFDGTNDIEMNVQLVDDFSLNGHTHPAVDIVDAGNSVYLDTANTDDLTNSSVEMVMTVSKSYDFMKEYGEAVVSDVGPGTWVDNAVAINALESNYFDLGENAIPSSVTLVTTVTNNYTFNDSVLPGGLVNGDVIIVMTGCKDSTNNDVLTAGYQNLGGQINSASVVTAFSHVYNSATTEANVAFSQQYGTAVITVFRGAAIAGDASVHDIAFTAVNTSVDPPAVEAPPGAMVLAGFFQTNDYYGGTAPFGYSNYNQAITNLNDQTLAVASKSISNAGGFVTEDPSQFTGLVLTTNNVQFTLSIKPLGMNRFENPVISFENVPVGKNYSCTLKLSTYINANVVFDGCTVHWPNSEPPDWETSNNVITMFTVDAGNNWIGAALTGYQI